MILKEIIKLLAADTIYLDHPDILNKHFEDAFASDLMSDALALINDDNVLLITGLANAQALRTAEMLDLNVILYVRNKMPDNEQIEMAKELGISLFRVPHNMFKTCGKLYESGLGHD